MTRIICFSENIVIRKIIMSIIIKELDTKRFHSSLSLRIRLNKFGSISGKYSGLSKQMRQILDKRGLRR